MITASQTFLLALVGALLLTGCHAFNPGNEITPTVTGQVRAADTLQPLAGVTVSRGGPDSGAPTKGGQRLKQGRPEITGADGVFRLAGRADITCFRHARTGTGRLAFQAPGYALWQTNFATADFTNRSRDDLPVIEAGTVLLHPLPK